MKEIKRGEIYSADFGVGFGSEQGGVRPVLILQNNTGNKHSPTTIVAAITGRKTKAALPTHVAIITSGLKTESTVLLEQIRTIDKARLGEYIGRLDSKTLATVDRAIVVSLGIKYLEGLAYAKSKNVIAVNPAEGVSLPKKIKKKAYRELKIDVSKTLTLPQVFQLIEPSKETPIHMQILFAVLMGLRRGEINGLKYSDVDYINRTLKIQRQLGKKPNSKAEDVPPKMLTKQEIKPKTPSSIREIPIPDYVFEAILEQRRIYEKNRRRRSKEFRDWDYICCSTYGNPRSKSYHQKYYKELLASLGLPDIHFHQLRNTYTTILLKHDFNIKGISHMLGHSKEIISADVYGDTAEIIEDCLYAIEPFMEEVLPESRKEKYYDYSDLKEIDEAAEEYLMAA